MQGLEAIVVVMGVEQGQLLAAVDGIVGVIDIEHDAFGKALEAGAKQIDHDQPHARQHHVGVAVRRARGIARVAHAGGKQLGDPGPSLDPAQQQHAAVGRQPPAIEAGAQFFVLDG